ncbi:MAG: hypothetical protein ABIP55_04290 [Tepidisphaeraceae bacterium]
MTKLMEQAIEKLRSLPVDKQDTVAGFVLSELESDRQWDQTSVKYGERLRKLADEALDNFRAGRTTELDPDSL